MKRKIHTAKNNYEIIGEIDTIAQLKQLIHEEINKGTSPEDIIVTDCQGITLKLLNDNKLVKQ